MSESPESLTRLSARVVAAHGRFMRVRLPDGRERLARTAGRSLQVVCGDVVSCEVDDRHDELRVVAVGPRKGALHRSNARGQPELIAANLTALVVVMAPVPLADCFITDRYLCAAQSAGIDAIVLLNKADLPCPPETEAALEVYSGLACAMQRVSARNGWGFEELRALLRDRTSVLVGQSGVGKSSLIRMLVPQSEASIGELLRDEGRHTTTAVRLYDLPGGGAIIDSPGVRDFAPPIDRLDGASLGFPEVAALSSGCRFSDCRHMREPDCAVLAAVGKSFDARRYESYRRMRRLFEQLQPPAGPRRRG